MDILDAGGDVLRSVRVASSAARSVAWSEDDQRLVVGAYDGKVHLISSDGDFLASQFDARFWPRSISVADNMLAVGSFWGAPHILDARTLHPIGDPNVATEGVNAVTYNPSAGRALLGTDSGAVLSLIRGASSERLTRDGLSRPTRSPILSLATNGNLAWAGTYSGEIHNLTRPGVVAPNLGSPVPSLTAFAEVVLAGTYNGDLVELDGSTLEITRRRDADHAGSIKSLARGNDGVHFLSAATDRVVRSGTFEERFPLWEHGNLVNAVALSWNCDVAASASRDHTAKVSKLKNFERSSPVVTLLGADESLKTVSVLGDKNATYVLAGSYDFGIYAWKVDWNTGGGNLSSGRRLTSLGQGISTSCLLSPTECLFIGWDGSAVEVCLDAGSLKVTSDYSLPELIGAVPR